MALSQTLTSPYSSLLLGYQPLNEQVQKDAENRARQAGAQSAASRGMTSPRGPALNTYNRLMSDFNIDQAKKERDYQLALQAGNRNVMASPGAVQPSAWSGILSPLMTGVGSQLAQPVTGALTKGATSLWDMGTKQLGDLYTSLAGGSSLAGPVAGWGANTGVASGFGAGEEAAAPFGSLIPDVGPAAEGISNAPWWEAGDVGNEMLSGFVW